MTGLHETLDVERPRVGFAVPRLLGDERLARLAAAGDERAFAAIYRRYGPDLHRYCRAILGNPDDAADALQNTMVSALRALPGERRKVALKPWLFRVAHNESISLLRARRTGAELDADKLTVPGADADAATAERLRQLMRDLGQLPERQRGALVMRELNGMSFEEIGASLSCSAAAGRQVVYEARLALQEMAEGREMECELARRAISERDGRVRRARKLRAHLRECDRCRSFAAAIDDRREDLAALAPALALPAAIGLLKGIGAAGTAGTGAGLGGSMAVKSATAVLALATVGAGAAGVGGLELPGFDGPQTRQGSPAAPPADAEAADGAGRASGAGGAAAPAGDSGAARGQAGARHRDGHSGPGQGDRAPGHRGSRPDGGRPPGQAHTPPGQAEAPPGQAQTPPGQTAAPPGQAQTPPGQAHTPPGQAAQPPGQVEPPPGQVGTPPGQVKTPPGQAHTPPGQAAATSTPLSPSTAKPPDTQSHK